MIVEIIGTILAIMYVSLWILGPIALIVGTIDAKSKGKVLNISKSGQWKMVDKKDFDPELPIKSNGQGYIVRKETERERRK